MVSHHKHVLDELGWRGLIHQYTEGLAESLAAGPVSAYCGFDPSAASLHVGSLVPVMGLVHLQRAGHRPIALVGAGTGMIGDPSGKSQERVLLTPEQVDEAARRSVSYRPPGDEHEDDDRGLEFTGRGVLTLCGFLAAMILGLYLLLPQLAGLEDTWRRIEDGSPYWMLVALLFGCGMFFGYVAMFRGIFLRAGSRIGRTDMVSAVLLGT